MTMTEARERTIAWLPAMIMVGAVVLILGGIAMGYYDKNAYEVQKGREAEVQAEILAATATAAVAFNDKQAAQEYAGALKANPEIEAAAIFGSSGTILASFTDRGAPVPEQVTLHGPIFSGNRVTVVVPVPEEAGPAGMVYLRAMTESRERRTARYGVIMLFAVMAGLMLTVVSLAQRILTRTNKKLERQAETLSLANARLQTEMSERARVEEALRQSHKMEAVGRLSGGIAHDFNNLLMIIQGNLQLLQKRLAEGKSDVSRHIDNARDGLTRAGRLTQQILAFSRQQPLSPQLVTFAQLIANIDGLLRHSVGENVNIQTHVDGTWPIVCDVNQMENVILNLAINARDAMPNGGILRLETSDLRIEGALEGQDGFQEDVAPGEYSCLKVIDNGSGMSAEVRMRAIDPFFTTKPFGQGTGLGLSMAFGFIRQSHGHLLIDSAPETGTTITILLPRAKREQ